MPRVVTALLSLLLAACGLFDATRVPLGAEDADALRFAERIQGFYAALENIPIDSLITYENRDLRVYFENARAFSDYYASLVGELRDADFRHFMLQDLDKEQIGGFLGKWHDVTFDNAQEADVKRGRLAKAINDSKPIAMLGAIRCCSR